MVPFAIHYPNGYFCMSWSAHVHSDKIHRGLALCLVPVLHDGKPRKQIFSDMAVAVHRSGAGPKWITVRHFIANKTLILEDWLRTFWHLSPLPSNDYRTGAFPFLPSELPQFWLFDRPHDVMPSQILLP